MAGKPPNPPPLGLEIPNLRECSRDMDFPKGVPCGKEPFLHVYWTDDDWGFVCVEHAAELERKNWIPERVHELGPDCGMPGSWWSLEENRCYIPEGEEPIVLTEAVGMEIPA